MIDITRNAVWTYDCCGKMDLDFPLVSCDTRYWPDNTCKCCFRLCGGVYNDDEREWYEPHDAIIIMESDYISGDSKEGCQMKARQWYNDNAVHALELATSILTKNAEIKRMEENFTKLKEIGGKVKKRIMSFIKHHSKLLDKDNQEQMLAWHTEQREPEDKGEISDGYHTFNELYYYRMLYNAAFFNLLPKEWVHKSKKHHDGEECFGGGWFVVMAELPTGLISNHYELKNWDLFQIPEKETADEWDGHTPQEAAERLHKYLLEKQGKKEATDLCHSKVTKTNNQVEFSKEEEARCKEAVIEKAVEWLKEHRDYVKTEDNGIAGWIEDEFIEDFTNYMKKVRL